MAMPKTVMPESKVTGVIKGLRGWRGFSLISKVGDIVGSMVRVGEISVVDERITPSPCSPPAGWAGFPPLNLRGGGVGVLIRNKVGDGLGVEVLVVFDVGIEVGGLGVLVGLGATEG